MKKNYYYVVLLSGGKTIECELMFTIEDHYFFGLLPFCSAHGRIESGIHKDEILGFLEIGPASEIQLDSQYAIRCRALDGKKWEKL